MSKTDDIIEAIGELKTDLSAKIDGIEGRLKDIEDAPKIAASRQLENSPVQGFVVTPNMNNTGNNVPVPVDYRYLVDQVLNHNFEIRIEPASDSPVFAFKLLVPRKYSNAAPAHWDLYGCDERVKVIPYSQGSNGVREWIDIVWKNFNPDLQAQITSDRIQHLSVDNSTPVRQQGLVG